MADTTNPAASGSDTTEGKWAKYIQTACGLLVVAAGALTALQNQFPQVVWLQVASVFMAGVVSVFTQLGFLKSRTLIKTALINAGADAATTTASPK